jgi:hypothetical protein
MNSVVYQAKTGTPTKKLTGKAPAKAVKALKAMKGMKKISPKKSK